MSYAIDELAPIMWFFFVILGTVLLIAICMLVFRFVAEDPCRAYNMIAFYWGRVGNHCA